MIQGMTFGLINGIIDMLALLTGLWATKVSKVGIIGAIVALMISNPFNDSYALYVSEEKDDEEKAREKAKIALLAQLATHFIFLLIIIFSPNTTIAILISFILSGITIFSFNLYNDINFIKTRNTLLIIALLVLVTYIADSSVYKYYK